MWSTNDIGKRRFLPGIDNMLFICDRDPIRMDSRAEYSTKLINVLHLEHIVLLVRLYLIISYFLHIYNLYLLCIVLFFIQSAFAEAQLAPRLLVADIFLTWIVGFLFSEGQFFMGYGRSSHFQEILLGSTIDHYAVLV